MESIRDTLLRVIHELSNAGTPVQYIELSERCYQALKDISCFPTRFSRSGIMYEKRYSTREMEPLFTLYIHRK